MHCATRLENEMVMVGQADRQNAFEEIAQSLEIRPLSRVESVYRRLGCFGHIHT
jgi:hypothetical protein